nr:MAG TPA: hypothetical protein [Caudoviricetes sp.]
MSSFIFMKSFRFHIHFSALRTFSFTRIAC